MADNNAFIEETEPHRRELLAHCYRMLGSFHDAEDVVQETYIRAWRAYGRFEHRASVRTWLYQIATNRCLSALAQRAPRVVPSALSAASSDPHTEPQEAEPEVSWLEPAPDALLMQDTADPAEIIAMRASLRLALIASLQHLPPRQRSVLILRDVLSFPAAEVAAMLDMTTVSVKSALQRARSGLQALELADAQMSEPSETRAREILDEYIAAFETADAVALERLLLEHASIEATPMRTWFAGRSACLPFLREQLVPAPGQWRMFPTRANGQPAAVAFRRDEDHVLQPYGICVLTLTESGISRITSFGDPKLVQTFGLRDQPATKPVASAA